jgi:bifunctional non-homologous end joining protein LigD
MAAGAGAEQLSLAIDQPASPATLPRLRPMKPLVSSAPFDDESWFFEPWWPGTPALVYVANGDLQLQIDHLADPRSCFPELGDAAEQFDARGGAIVEGTLLVLDDAGRPDAELLRRRLSESGGRAGSPALVCSDLLHVGPQSLIQRPFAERRAELARLLRDGDACVVSRGVRGEGTTLAQAVAQMGLAEIGARRLDARYRPGAADGSWLRLPVAEEPQQPTRPLLALLQRLPL